jgi:hypothetical protein
MDICPFSEIVAGPEADGLKLIAGATMAEEGDNIVITVSGAPIPASLKDCT